MRKYDYRILGKDVCVSNNTWKTGLNGNDLILGGTGSGKTTSQINLLLKTLKETSAVVVDSKGLLYREFKDELEAKGYNVHRISFINPLEGEGYNPLAYIRKDNAGNVRYQDIITIADILINGIGDEEPFWPISAKNLLELLIAYCIEVLPEEDHNMDSILRLYHIFIKPNGWLPFAEYVEDNPHSFIAARYNEIMQTKSADRTYSCILAFCNCALKWFSFPEAKHLFLSSNLIDFHKIANEKTCLFVDVSDCDFSMSALINLFFSQLIQTLIADANDDPIGRLPISTRIILDDFGANIKIKDFDKLIAITRSRDIQLSVVLQSISQLETNYGKSQQTSILNNFDHVIFLGGINDYESAKFIAARVAKSEETVLSMPRDKEIIISSGHKAIYVDKLRPYEEDFDISKYLGMEI